jgi:hypothetical protein
LNSYILMGWGGQLPTPSLFEPEIIHLTNRRYTVKMIAADRK